MDFTELEERARIRMGAAAYDYYAGGADDEATLVDNVSAWGRIPLRPRVLRDVSAVSLTTTVLGDEITMPLLLAPTAYQRLAHEDGEVATARAAAGAGTVMVASTMATTSMEDIAAAAPDAPRWFQLYIHRDRGLTADLVARAAAAGYRAVVLTVDVPVLGRRRRDELHRFNLPDGLVMANLGVGPPDADGSAIAAYAEVRFDPSVTFADIEWLRGLSDLPVVVKGVMRSDDAVAAVGAGGAAVIVSNHGGRQLDTTQATAHALVEVAEAVGDDAEVYVDGGIRRGTDVVKALAMGARAVLVGRPALWGLAAAGEEGVRGVLDAIREETERAFALCGTATVADVTFDLLA